MHRVRPATKPIFATLIAGSTIVCSPPTGAQDPAAFADFLKWGGKAVAPARSDLRDCSQESIAYLDDHVVDSAYNGACSWPLVWGIVAKDGGICVYLQKPDRRGLTVAEAQVVLADRTGMQCPEPATPTCDTHDIRVPPQPNDHEQEGRGDDYSYSIGFVALEGQFAPLDRVQHAFANRMLAQIRNFPRELLKSDYVGEYFPAADAAPKRLGLGFELSQRGEFASLDATGTLTWATGKVFRQRSVFSGWLLHVPSGKVLTFDDLFADPRRVRREFSALAVPSMSQRFKKIYVNGRNEAERRTQEAMLDEVVLRATALDSPQPWQVTLSICQPGVLVTFETQPVSQVISDRPGINLGAAWMRQWLKPEYRDAF